MQELIIIDGVSVIVQDKRNIYQDDIDGFINDYGEKPIYKSIDYNRNVGHCMLDGKVSEFPNAVCEVILNSINGLLKSQEKRRYDWKTLETVKEEKIKSLKNARDTEEQSPITYNGYRWDFDDKAIQRINGAIIALSNGGEITWTSADNEEIRGVTADDLRGVISASAVRSNALHVKYRELRERVEQCTTKEQVEAINW